MPWQAPMVETVDRDNVDSGIVSQVEDPNTTQVFLQSNQLTTVYNVPVEQKTGGFTMPDPTEYWHRGWSMNPVYQDVLVLDTMRESPDYHAVYLSPVDSLNAAAMSQQQVTNKFTGALRAPGINEGL